MKFKVYVQRQGRLITLWDARRTRTGLYFHGLHGHDSYMTYHENGEYWIRSGRTKMVKKRRPPLADLKGAYTLSTGTFTILAPQPSDRVVESTQLRGEDIVVEYSGIFGAEVILSDSPLQLEAIPSRVNSQLFVKANLAPVITFEFFENPTNVLPSNRFPVPPISAMTFDEHERI